MENIERLQVDAMLWDANTNTQFYIELRKSKMLPPQNEGYVIHTKSGRLGRQQRWTRITPAPLSLRDAQKIYYDLIKARLKSGNYVKKLSPNEKRKWLKREEAKYREKTMLKINH